MNYTKTVLVVDDADMVRTMLGFMLDKAGYNTLLGVDGKDALTFLNGTEVDLIITDLNMPNMDGAEFITEIRSKAFYQYTPVVLFVAENAEDNHAIRAAAGASIVFDKKNINEKLLPVVRILIG